MLNDEHNTADTIRAPGSNHEDASTRVQLSANTSARLEKLARWRIDPTWLKFPNRGSNSEGGFAIVSRALLATSPDKTREQVVEPNSRDLMSNNRIAKLQGDRDAPQAEESSEEGKYKNKEGAEGESDDETSGQWKVVAVKKMKMKTQDDTVQILGLTLREAEFLVKLSHENVIKLEGFVEDVSKGVSWLVFPWQENGTLKDFVASHEWEIPERIALIYDVASGVEYLHSRESPICHGDLKSINVLVNSKCRAIITDFGSADNPGTRSPKGRERTAEEQVAPSIEATLCPSTNTITLTSSHYTTRWAAPEVLNEGETSLASDIWAFGWVAYEVITNSIPFQGVKDNTVVMRIVKGDLPVISNDARMLLIQALCSLLGHCWSGDPNDRPTAIECGDAIRWMPMIIPNPRRTADTANLTGDSAKLLIQLGIMYHSQSDYSNASKYFARALDIYSDIGDSEGKAEALLNVAQVHRVRQEYSQAVTYYSEALGISIDTRGRAVALLGLAEVHRLQGEYSQASQFYSECLQIRTDIGDTQGRTQALGGLAEVHRVQGEYSQAITLLSESVEFAIKMGDTYSKGWTLWFMADMYREQHDHKNAIHHYEQAAEMYKEIGHPTEAVILEEMADLRRSIEQGAA